jgi:hypothetical protein
MKEGEREMERNKIPGQIDKILLQQNFHPEGSIRKSYSIMTAIAKHLLREIFSLFLFFIA